MKRRDVNPYEPTNFSPPVNTHHACNKLTKVVKLFVAPAFLGKKKKIMVFIIIIII